MSWSSSAAPRWAPSRSTTPPRPRCPASTRPARPVVDVGIPAGTTDGPTKLTLTGAATGTKIPVGIAVDERLHRTIQVLATNDFHGRIANDPSSAAAGAGVMAGAVKQLRAANPNTVFAAAGDLIGASTFESFIQNDKPTIDALNEAGLEVSAAGNHEFDQGADDLVDRVMAPYDPVTNPFGGAEWEYIAANIRNNSDDSHLLAPTWTEDVRFDQGRVRGCGHRAPAGAGQSCGIEDIHVTDIVDEVNDAAERPEGRWCGHGRDAGARGCAGHQLCRDR